MKELALKLKTEPGVNDEILIENFKTNFSKLLEKTQGKLNQYVKDDNVDIEDAEIRDILVDSLENVAIVGSYVEWDVFFSQFDTWDISQDMDQFLFWMQQYIDERSSAYKETAFVREMNFDLLQKVIDHCFEEYILVYNSFEEEYLGLNQEQIINIVKVLRTLASMIVERGYSYKHTMSVSYEMFVWPEEIFKLFWNVIDGNRDVLWRGIVMQKLNSLEEELKDMKEKV